MRNADEIKFSIFSLRKLSKFRQIPARTVFDEEKRLYGKSEYSSAVKGDDEDDDADEVVHPKRRRGLQEKVSLKLALSIRLLIRVIY